MASIHQLLARHCIQCVGEVFGIKVPAYSGFGHAKRHFEQIFKGDEHSQKLRASFHFDFTATNMASCLMMVYKATLQLQIRSIGALIRFIMQQKTSPTEGRENLKIEFDLLSCIDKINSYIM